MRGVVRRNDGTQKWMVYLLVWFTRKMIWNNSHSRGTDPLKSSCWSAISEGLTTILGKPHTCLSEIHGVQNGCASILEVNKCSKHFLLVLDPFLGKIPNAVNFASENTQNVLWVLPTMTASLGFVGGANASQPEAKTVHVARDLGNGQTVFYKGPRVGVLAGHDFDI